MRSTPSATTSRRTRGTATCAWRPSSAPASTARATPPPPRAEGQRHPILAGLEEADTLPFGGYLPVVSVDAGTEVLATFIPDFPIYPPETSWMREPRSDFAAITVRTAPSGGKLVWFVADLDRCFARDEAFEHALLFENAVRWALGDRLRVSLKGNARHRDGRPLRAAGPARSAPQQSPAVVARAGPPVRPGAGRTDRGPPAAAAPRPRSRSGCGWPARGCRHAATATRWSSPSTGCSTTSWSRSERSPPVETGIWARAPGSRPR